MLDRQDYTPEWLKQGPEEQWPRFGLRAGSILERDQFEAEMEGRHRAGLVLSYELLLAAVAGIRALVEGEDAAQLIELIQSDFGKEELTPAEKAKVKAATDILAEHWPEYAALVEKESRRNAILPTLAFMRWCDGWTNVKDAQGEVVDYARDGMGQITDGVLRRVPFTMIRAAGVEAYGLQYGRTQAKNSAPLSKSSPRRKRNISSPGESKAGGKSVNGILTTTPGS